MSAVASIRIGGESARLQRRSESRSDLMALARAGLMSPFGTDGRNGLASADGLWWGSFRVSALREHRLADRGVFGLVAVVAGKPLLRGLMAPSLASDTLCTLGTLLMGCPSRSVASQQVLVTLTGGSGLRLLGGLGGFWSWLRCLVPLKSCRGWC